MCELRWLYSIANEMPGSTGTVQASERHIPGSSLNVSDRLVFAHIFTMFYRAFDVFSRFVFLTNSALL